MNYSKIFNGASAADMVREVGLAITALKNEVESRGLKPGKLIMAGHSAGAHIMLLYAYTQYRTCPLDTRKRTTLRSDGRHTRFCRR